jgi:leucyl aminopeptidase
VAAPRVLVIGLGDPGKFGVPQYLKAVGDAARTLKTGAVTSALFTLGEVAVAGRDAAWNLRNAVIAADHACYRYTATLGAKNKKREEKGLVRFEVSGDDANALAQGIAIAAGVQFTRELGNLPPNICNPAYLAEQAHGLRRAQRRRRVRRAGRERWRRSAWARCSQSRAARANRAATDRAEVERRRRRQALRPGRQGHHLRHRRHQHQAQGGMEEMKYDMCGAASVFGTFEAARAKRLPVNLVVIAGGGEHAGRQCLSPQSDVITTMSGKTIEVGNTDAEGRLILCDALTYARASNRPR